MLAVIAENLVILLLVAASATYVVYQTTQTLRGRRSKVGQCCAKGCSHSEPAATKPPTERIVFLPAELLTRKR